MNMKVGNALRVKAGVLLLCVSAVIYAAEICRRNHVLTKTPPDPVTLHEKRLARLRRRLPPRAVVGYVTDVAPADGPESWRRFATTQYSLAPGILKRTTGGELVVCDFKDPGALPAFADGNGLLPVEDFGEGLELFRQR
jgi:hypothetical protein